MSTPQSKTTIQHLRESGLAHTGTHLAGTRASECAACRRYLDTGHNPVGKVILRLGVDPDLCIQPTIIEDSSYNHDGSPMEFILEVNKSCVAVIGNRGEITISVFFTQYISSSSDVLVVREDVGDPRLRVVFRPGIPAGSLWQAVNDAINLLDSGIASSNPSAYVRT